jgi:hypothetical protein
MRQGDLEVVASYLHGYEAHLAQGRLEADGIPAWVLDEHQIRMRWWLGLALGGVKVAVRRTDAAAARSILAADHAEELAPIRENELPAQPDHCCPRCAQPPSREIRRRLYPNLPQWLALVAGLVVGFIAPHRRVAVERECSSCGHVWVTSATSARGRVRKPL